jgi:threonine synthase
MKTIAFEIAEQLSWLDRPERGPGQPWSSPDWYIQAVSGGIGPFGVLKGFGELRAMQMVNRIPAIACIQTEGCAPMVTAWHSGSAQASPVHSPMTHISTLSTGDPGRAYTLLRDKMLAGGGGVMEAVSDEEAYRAMHLIARLEGLSVEPAAAVAFAGVIKLAQAGTITADQRVVINCSGHTMPIEKHLLGQDWSQDIDFVESGSSGRPQEGLLTALMNVDRGTRRVLIVDDHQDARRLIRRILEAHGDFKILESHTARDGLLQAKSEPPDLIILDLMMPGMDGFEFLERLQSQARTASIPILVVTAKELTEAEIRFLRDRTSALSPKGELVDAKLVEDILGLLDRTGD